MSHVGPYRIPFPYVPYPLQEHAMTALRDYLEQSRKDEDAEGMSTESWVRDPVTIPATAMPTSLASTMVATSRSGAKGPRPRVAVLESPTGTGKSQMLLNSVLSNFFDVVERAQDTVSVASASGSVVAEPPAAVATDASCESQTDKNSHLSLPSLTLEETIAQREMEEKMEQLRRERRARVRAQRHQIQRARKLMHLSQQQATSSGGDKHFILTQDPLAWYAEQSPAIEVKWCSDGIGDRGHALPLSLASSSSSSSSSSASTSDESDDSDAEGQLEAALTTLVPLRKPKIFFSSRTHTQLQQLMEDLKRTAFAQRQLRPRLLSIGVAEPAASRSAAKGARVEGGKHGSTASEPPRQREQQQQLPRRLTAVHVASRKHLCLNVSLRRRAGDSNDRLNYYCREAIRFERSKEGRQHRRQQQQQQQQQRDLEDDKGCIYCVESHLRSLMTYLREEQRSADATADVADGCASASSNGTPPSSVYTMDRLRKVGAELQACPYIATRLLLRGADIVFIPYGYVLDEGQRSVLLGGPSTNPATASEAEAVFSDRSRHCSAADREDGGFMATDGGGIFLPGDVAPHDHSSLGSVLYHRRQRVTATEVFKNRRRQQQQRNSIAMASHTHGGTAHMNGEDEADAVWQAMARCAPPSLRGDIIVFDEAHNIADHCRSISTVSVSPWHLQLARQLFEVYLERYASRLLTRNKQRLRELIRFHSCLLHFCEHATDTALVEDGGGAEGGVASPISALSAQPPSAAAHTRVLSFNSFLFDANIDCVDVHAFLAFLADSQLPWKLQGFVSHLLEAEQQQQQQRQEEEEGKKKKVTTTAAGVTRAVSGIDYTARLTAGVKRPRSNRIGLGVSSANAEAPRPRRFLSSIASPDHRESTADGQRAPPHLSLSELLSQPLQRTGAAMRATAGDASAIPSSYDPVQLRALAAEALQRVERLLGALYISDTASTRVLWTPPPPSRHAASSTQQEAGTLKIIQLEPGMHTFAPLVMEARAVVLAGGTMQPLALTCGPLLPLSPTTTDDDAYANPNRRSSAAPTASVMGSSAAPSPTSSHFYLISEGHVVPSSSVQVWALGTGPSGLRMELSQQALGLRGGATNTINETSPLRSDSSSVISPHADRVLSEVGSTLLNLARVFPPAGVICFFTSHDVMDTTVSVLEHTGYYAQINEVRRIFRERRNGTGEAMAELLREYQDWICCKDLNGSSVDPTVVPTTTAASAPLSPNAATPEHVTQPSRRGAFLFAVMGGRLSEGINFSDDLGRAVVVLGMPYANATDVELQMNLRYVVQTRLKANVNAGLEGACSLAGSSASIASSPFTCTEEWGLYMDSMMRTVNQCIGRCIRHAGDYATIILLDARYAERQDARRRVSAWLQPSMRVAKSFGQCFSGVREFFAGRQRNV